MNAFRCDCCGNLAAVEDTAQITVSLDTAKDDAGSTHPTEWQVVDICGLCLQRPMEEVLAVACLDFKAAWEDRMKGPLDSPPAAPGEG